MLVAPRFIGMPRPKVYIMPVRCDFGDGNMACFSSLDNFTIFHCRSSRHNDKLGFQVLKIKRKLVLLVCWIERCLNPSLRGYAKKMVAILVCLAAQLQQPPRARPVWLQVSFVASMPVKEAADETGL